MECFNLKRNWMPGILKHAKHPKDRRHYRESNALETIARRKIMFRTLFTAIRSGQTFEFQAKLSISGWVFYDFAGQGEASSVSENFEQVPFCFRGAFLQSFKLKRSTRMLIFKVWNSNLESPNMEIFRFLICWGLAIQKFEDAILFHETDRVKADKFEWLLGHLRSDFRVSFLFFWLKFIVLNYMFAKTASLLATIEAFNWWSRERWFLNFQIKAKLSLGFRKCFEGKLALLQLQLQVLKFVY